MIFLIRLIMLFAGISAMLGGFGLIPAVALWVLIISFIILKEKAMDYYGFYLIAGLALVYFECYFTAATFFILPTKFTD